MKRTAQGSAVWLGAAWLLGACVASQPLGEPEGRPQMSADDATRHRAQDYLARGPTPWQPAAPDARPPAPDFIVAADGSGSHRSLQAAIDAVPARAESGPGARRWTIQIRAGRYRGAVCIQGKAPLAILGDPEDRDAVTLVDGRYNGLPKRAGIDAAQACHPNLAAATHGTSGSATVIIASDDVRLAHLTMANDATEDTSSTVALGAQGAGAQAVALMTQADRIQLEGVRLVSYQDTFYVKRPPTPTPGVPARVFVRGSWIEGDVDFVFGNATLVIDDSTLVSRAGRTRPSRGGYVLAPSTPAGEALGFLVQRSRFVAEPGVPAGSVALGRAWDEGVPPGQWRGGASPKGPSPNGQALVRDSALGPHIARWAASTSRRPFKAPASSTADEAANRLFEHGNTPLPADIAREVLAPGDGWASTHGGTRGGADAAPEDVSWAHNRAELAAALQPHPRPRIVKVVGRIDLAVDDRGRPLGAEDFRDPRFGWAAFAAAYDPAIWGRQPPAGPLEEARAASARAQAARVLLKVPSRTTLMGIGRDAQILRGGLLLDGAQDIIVRNIHFRDAHDHFPAWDPRDNQHGEWNAELDNLSLRGASRVWIDHCTFDDGERSAVAEPRLFGRPLQRHDGLLDITRGSDLVTVSWNHFRDHDKTVLVGGSDRHAEDVGRLRVSFHHNLWQQTRERSPRVRFGRVHVLNNLYLIDDAAAFGYSLGVGHRSALLSQSNVWQTPGGVPAAALVRRLGGTMFEDQGSLLDGRPVDLLAALRAANPGVAIASSVAWTPPYALRVDAAAEVAARVRAGAGAGRLWTGTAIPFTTKVTP